MTALPESHFRRCDPASNMARFYHLSLEPTLFGGIALLRRWGRIGTTGQQRMELHADVAAAEAAYLRACVARLKRGYLAV